MRRQAGAGNVGTRLRARLNRMGNDKRCGNDVGIMTEAAWSMAAAGEGCGMDV